MSATVKGDKAPVRLKPGAPGRKVTEVGPGDYLKVEGAWMEIAASSAYGLVNTPREWYIRTVRDGIFKADQIERYARAEDLEAHS